MIAFFKTIIYIPLYNILVFILNFIPKHDVGIAIVVLTLIVKFVLYPISKKAAVTQFQMKRHDGELKQIREKYKDNKEEQALQMMAFYKKYNINPFLSLVTVFIQIPIIYSLYYIFLHSGLPSISHELLYSFITTPTGISMNFLGFINVAEKNIYLALLAGLSTYFQIKNSSAMPEADKNASGLANDLSKAMTSQMKYSFPVIVFLISWKISGAVALYWLVSNLFSIVQDYYIKKRLSSV